MPRQRSHPSPQRFLDVAAVASSSLLDFLVPSFAWSAPRKRQRHNAQKHSQLPRSPPSAGALEAYFFEAISSASNCSEHRRLCHVSDGRKHEPARGAMASRRPNTDGPRVVLQRSGQHIRNLSTFATLKQQPDPGGTNMTTSQDSAPRETFRRLFDSKAKKMASHSHLPRDFFDDVFDMQVRTRDWTAEQHSNLGRPLPEDQDQRQTVTDMGGAGSTTEAKTSVDLESQIKLLQSVRELEEKLAKAKRKLHHSLEKGRSKRSKALAHAQGTHPAPVVLTKEDYKGLVDLYYYSHRDRFTPHGPDYSPSPIVLEDYTFKLSERFDNPESVREDDSDDPTYESPLLEIEKTLLSNQRREISTMQAFVNLLLDDTSSNRALFTIYKQFPSPGVSSLPKGIIRMFLQRMSTPWIKSKRAMLRYLSLIDDMEEAKLPITRAEWSSAIYLAGRSLGKTSVSDVSAAIDIWRKMEHEAGVRATHVTFNILFDIAVRAGKYTLAENIMKEMYARDLRLNRLGRVSLIYYHGIRGDGDAVRRTYRDFVEAGEIVDTLVLNCVIASLLNAQEPSAAEQIYERMKDLQKRLETGQRADGSETFYIRYPNPGEFSTINREAASNSLGRILLDAPRLKQKLPDHHTELQNIMPLRPDHMTFRAMVSYHANVTGDLDRITVLIKEMTEDYGLPMRNVFFQLLLKGFALHGRANTAEDRWTIKRLALVWRSCRQAILDAKAAHRAMNFTPEEGTEVDPLPTVASLEGREKAKKEAREALDAAKQKRLDPWDDFVLDLAAFPRERRKPIERIHAQLFDDEPAQSRGFLNPFFPSRKQEASSNQEMFYALGNEKLDHEEGEYVLPSPTRASIANSTESDEWHAGEDVPQHESHMTNGQPTSTRTDTPGEGFAAGPHSSDARPIPLGRDSDAASRSDSTDILQRHADQQHEIDEKAEDAGEYRQYATQRITGDRPMACWLLRAYARCTGSRAKVEEVYAELRKVWKPENEQERDSVVRVLQRCLRDCDRYGGHML